MESIEAETTSQEDVKSPESVEMPLKKPVQSDPIEIVSLDDSDEEDEEPIRSTDRSEGE